MNLSEIKKKYKDILRESSDSSSSSDDFESSLNVNRIPLSINSMPQKHQRAQSMINKQNNLIQKKQKQNTSLHTQIIHLKERLGQANQKLQNKNCQLKNQFDKKSQIFQEKKILQKHLLTYQEQIQRKDKQLIQLKANKIGFQHKLKELQNQYIDKDLDRELLKKQISFYEIQQKKFKQILKDKDEEIKVLLVKNKKVKCLESQNQRLKNDIKRLVSLLQEKKIFKPTKNFNQSYMGRQHNESECWFNRDLIFSAEQFLSKHKINQKPVLKSLVKLLQTIKTSNTNHSKRSVSQKSKSKARRDNSLTYKDISIILPKDKNNSIKTGQTYSVYDSIFHSKSKLKSVYKQTIQQQQRLFNCRQIIREYKLGMDELIDNKVCSKGKIRKLTQWLVSSIDNVVKEEYINFQ